MVKTVQRRNCVKLTVASANDVKRGELKHRAEALLDECRLKREGYFHPAPIREKWNEHLQGHRNWRYHLWDVLMFHSLSLMVLRTRSLTISQHPSI